VICCIVLVIDIAGDLFCILAFILFVLIIIVFLTLDFRLADTLDSN
jgi:hypothetical protein